MGRRVGIPEGWSHYFVDAPSSRYIRKPSGDALSGIQAMDGDRYHHYGRREQPKDTYTHGKQETNRDRVQSVSRQRVTSKALSRPEMEQWPMYVSFHKYSSFRQRLFEPKVAFQATTAHRASYDLISANVRCF